MSNDPNNSDTNDTNDTNEFDPTRPYYKDGTPFGKGLPQPIEEAPLWTLEALGRMLEKLELPLYYLVHSYDDVYEVCTKAQVNRLREGKQIHPPHPGALMTRILGYHTPN